MHKKIFIIASIWAMLLQNECFAQGSEKPKKIGVIQIVEHTSLDNVRKKALEEVLSHPKHANTEIEYLNAQGNFITLGQIGRKFLGSELDLIFAIGTPAAQVVISRNHKIPVVFSPITDPVSAKLVQSNTNPAGIATGASDYISMQEQLSFIKEIQPKIKRLGIIYNSGEANSQKISTDFIETARKIGFIPVEAIAQNTSMVLPVCRSTQVDAWYIPTDNTVASAIESVIKVGQQQKIPIFVADKAHLHKGAFGGVSLDYSELGTITGRILVNVLDGQLPSNLPVQFVSKPTAYINVNAAKKLGIIIPEELKKTATLIN